jgi:hypothetical protein
MAGACRSAALLLAGWPMAHSTTGLGAHASSGGKRPGDGREAASRGGGWKSARVLGGILRRLFTAALPRCDVRHFSSTRYAAECHQNPRSTCGQKILRPPCRLSEVASDAMKERGLPLSVGDPRFMLGLSTPSTTMGGPLQKRMTARRLWAWICTGGAACWSG